VETTEVEVWNEETLAAETVYLTTFKSNHPALFATAT